MDQKNPKFRHYGNKILSSEKQITLVWIPSHVGIAQNEKADEEAKKATQKDTIENNFSEEADAKKQVKDEMKKQQILEWNTTSTYLKNYNKDGSQPEYQKTHPRVEQKILFRLRTGHTRYTKEELYTKQIKMCTTCHKQDSVEHILFECDKDERKKARKKYKIEKINLIETSKSKNIINYLKDINLINEL
jgi:hypothetical protein